MTDPFLPAFNLSDPIILLDLVPENGVPLPKELTLPCFGHIVSEPHWEPGRGWHYIIQVSPLLQLIVREDWMKLDESLWQRTQ